MRRRKKKDEASEGPKFNYIIDLMLHIKFRRNKSDPVEPAQITENGEMEVIPMLLSCVKFISSVVLHLPNDLIKKENKLMVRDTIKEVMVHFKHKPPLMNPIKDMKIDDEELKTCIARKQELSKEYRSLRANLNIDIAKNLELYEEKQKNEKKLRFLNEKIDQGGEMILKEDLSSMKRVMRRFGLLDKNDIVMDKGRVAGQVSSCDELMMTELLLSGFFNHLNPKEVAAILSCLVHDENSGDVSKVIIKQENLAKAFREILEQAERIYEVYSDCKLNIDKETYMNSFKPQLIEVVHRWCEGASFLEICKMSDTYEGSIIRCMRRLDELLKELCSCAKVMGNLDLQTKFEGASDKLRRGIVFAASLYL